METASKSSVEQAPEACVVCFALVKHTKNAVGEWVTSAAHRSSLRHLRAESAAGSSAARRRRGNCVAVPVEPARGAA